MQFNALALLTLATTALAMPAADALESRQATCRVFSLWQNPLTTGPLPKFVGEQCCCRNAGCELRVGEAGVLARCDSLSGSFTCNWFMNAGAGSVTGTNKIDYNGFEYTVAARGGC
ncbi:hypothetical protein CSOJ01_11254 [Colletotrichum sojae]|uniref:Uncharacterized protein n=1 Tax=Colletotrichum sojae TaxID=2175907 RepID=A0A8H6IXX6_9PEZI|nr:hypothetical protein CSOJ01_11254 [Colletotrichum sojae]